MLLSRFFLLTILMILASFAGYAQAETNISGYASIVAGKVVSGDRFLADYPKTGVYDNDISFAPDTSVGVQLSTDVNEDVSFTVQLAADGATDFDANISWAYINYQLSPTWSFQAGRKRLPLYYYSDFFDVAYVYNWIRPPADNYTWQISKYNGVNLLYENVIAGFNTSFNIYTGREDSHNNDLLSFLSNASVNETWKNMLGTVLESSNDFIDLRLSYLQSQLDREINGTLGLNDVKQVFSGVSVNFYFGDLSLLSEFNRYQRDATDTTINTNMISLAYTIGDFTPHITRSALKQEVNQDGKDENHSTMSYGVKWQVKPSMAFKIQYDKVTDKGVNVPVLGDSELISMGLDFIFH